MFITSKLTVYTVTKKCLSSKKGIPNPSTTHLPPRLGSEKYVLFYEFCSSLIALNT